MPRARDPNRDKAFEIWKQHKGEMKLKDIASELNVSEGTVRGWKAKDKWDDASIGTFQTKKRNAPKKKKQKKRSGNPNPSHKFSEHNSFALKHGLFSRYMPKQTLELMGMIAGANPADLIWMQIEIQFAAIIRAQEIMFVEAKDELIKELKKVEYENVPYRDEDGKPGLKPVAIKKEYEFQFAWDRQATFMNAQSKALAELRGSIKQFLELADSADERRLKLEHMQLSIDKTKAEIDRLQGDKEASEDWVTALKKVAEKRKQVKVNEQTSL